MSLQHLEKQSWDAPNEVSLKEIIIRIKNWTKYLRSKLIIILVFALIGAASGGLYSIISPKKYVAQTNFVFEDSGSGGDGGALSLLGMGTGVETGLFQGDNLIWLYTSRHMIQKTLLASVPGFGKPQVMINWFISMDKQMQKAVDKIKRSGTPVLFNANLSSDSLTTIQNSILGLAVNIIRNKYIKVEMIDKTSALISVKVTASNELFAKNFADHIVASVNNYYIQTKTKKAAEQVTVLEDKVSEFNKNINSSMYQAASSTDNVPYANPSLQTLRVAPQRKTVDIQVNSAIYTQMVQQLEGAKITLAKETPLIQVVDAPILPLNVEKPGLVKYALIFGFVFLFITTGILILKEAIRRIMAP